VGLFVGLGCGALLLLGGAGAAAAYFMARSAAAEFSSKLEEVSKGGGAPIATAVPAPDDGAPVATSAPATGDAAPLETGAPVASSSECARAAACCEAMITKTGGGAEALKGCQAFRSLPNIAACKQALETYKKMAPLTGVKCE
jgi:hypothetical protein